MWFSIYRTDWRHASASRAPSRRLRDTDRSSEDDLASVKTSLTAREREIPRLVREGKTNTEIAGGLWVASSTVKKHLENVYDKLGVASRTAAATVAEAAWVALVR